MIAYSPNGGYRIRLTGSFLKLQKADRIDWPFVFGTKKHDFKLELLVLAIKKTSQGISTRNNHKVKTS